MHFTSFGDSASIGQARQSTTIRVQGRNESDPVISSTSQHQAKPNTRNYLLSSSCLFLSSSRGTTGWSLSLYNHRQLDIFIMRLDIRLSGETRRQSRVLGYLCVAAQALSLAGVFVIKRWAAAESDRQKDASGELTEAECYVRSCQL